MSRGDGRSNFMRNFGLQALIYSINGFVPVVAQNIQFLDNNANLVEDGNAPGTNELHIKDKIAFGYRFQPGHEFQSIIISIQ